MIAPEQAGGFLTMADALNEIGSRGCLQRSTAALDQIKA
jgi:hypothetical protein